MPVGFNRHTHARTHTHSTHTHAHPLRHAHKQEGRFNTQYLLIGVLICSDRSNLINMEPRYWHQWRIIVDNWSHNVLWILCELPITVREKTRQPHFTDRWSTCRVCCCSFTTLTQHISIIHNTGVSVWQSGHFLPAVGNMRQPYEWSSQWLHLKRKRTNKMFQILSRPVENRRLSVDSGSPRFDAWLISTPQKHPACTHVVWVMMSYRAANQRTNRIVRLLPWILTNVFFLIGVWVCVDDESTGAKVKPALEHHVMFHYLQTPTRGLYKLGTLFTPWYRLKFENRRHE